MKLKSAVFALVLAAPLTGANEAEAEGEAAVEAKKELPDEPEPLRTLPSPCRFEQDLIGGGRMVHTK